MRRTALERFTPLRARTPLKARPAARKTPRDTGPTREDRLTCYRRDDYKCVCCGRNVTGVPHALQHRDARGMGGTSDPLANSPANLITMLDECHRRVESRIDPEDNAKGYWLRMGEDPREVPVMVFSEHGSGITVWLTGTGEYALEPMGGERG